MKNSVLSLVVFFMLGLTGLFITLQKQNKLQARYATV
jgi:hypothetical protein